MPMLEITLSPSIRRLRRVHLLKWINLWVELPTTIPEEARGRREAREARDLRDPRGAKDPRVSISESAEIFAMVPIQSGNQSVKSIVSCNGKR